jgi:hypothetical protein
MVSISPVRIGNMALSHIGAGSTIESMSEQSVEARQINLWYDFSRRQALEGIDWSFARKRLALSLHNDPAPELEWSYRYQYPADAVIIRRLVNPLGKQANAVPYRVENSDDGQTMTILTNMPEAVAEYTFDLTATSLFSPMFIEALSYLLAHHIAFTLTGKMDLSANMLQMYVAIMRMAAANNGNEEVDVEPRDAEWIRSR